MKVTFDMQNKPSNLGVFPILITFHATVLSGPYSKMQLLLILLFILSSPHTKKETGMFI